MAQITEAQVYSAFGLEAPDDTGAGEQVQVVAEPATQEEATITEAGGNEQEVAEPAEAEVEDNTESADADNPEDAADAAPTKPVLTKEQRRENAQRRRQQEQQAAIDAALQAEKDKHQKELEELFRRTGMKNTFTGEAITTMEQFRSWDKQFKDQQLQKDLQAGKVSREGIEQIVSEHPIVKQAAEVVQRNEADQKRQQQEAAAQRIQEEITQIGKLNSSIKNVNDLLTMPKAKEFYEFVQKGYSFIDAYKLANFEELTSGNAEAARQAAMNNARGKQHMTPVGNTRGQGAISVPSSQIAMYRAFNPNATEADIQAHYNKYKKNGG